MTAAERREPGDEPDEVRAPDDVDGGTGVDGGTAGSPSVQVEDDGTGPVAADRGRGVPEPAD